MVQDGMYTSCLWYIFCTKRGYIVLKLNVLRDRVHVDVGGDVGSGGGGSVAAVVVVTLVVLLRLLSH